MRLRPEDHLKVAQKAHYMLDVTLGLLGQDSVVLVGDGVDDLDRAIETLQRAEQLRGSKALIDLGTRYSAYRPCDVEDLTAIREQYIAIHGPINKPDAYQTGAFIALNIA